MEDSVVGKRFGMAVAIGRMPDYISPSGGKHARYIPYKTLHHRIVDLGWSAERALTQPVITMRGKMSKQE